jgi:hypothetical protein
VAHRMSFLVTQPPSLGQKLDCPLIPTWVALWLDKNLLWAKRLADRLRPHRDFSEVAYEIGWSEIHTRSISSGLSWLKIKSSRRAVRAQVGSSGKDDQRSSVL